MRYLLKNEIVARKRSVVLNKEREKKKRKKDRRSPSDNFQIISSQFEIRFNQVDVGGQIVQTKFIELNFINEYHIKTIDSYINFTIIFLHILIPFKYIYRMFIKMWNIFPKWILNIDK